MYARGDSQIEKTP